MMLIIKINSWEWFNLKKISDNVYDVGCLGKISDYQKSKDGRILINLTGSHKI